MAPPLPPRPPPERIIYLIRHGQTHMNVWLRNFRDQHGPHVEVTPDLDPRLFDTRLTPQGVAQAESLAALLRATAVTPEVILVSPLRRAVHTAHLAFPPAASYPTPLDTTRTSAATTTPRRLVEPLAAERCWHSSDVGTRRSAWEETIFREIQDQDGEDVVRDEGSGACREGTISTDYTWIRPTEDIWWYNGGVSDHEAIVLEPLDDFYDRMEKLRLHLYQRPERTMALVAHWGVLHALTGEDFDNCEMRPFAVEQLSVHRHIVM